MRGAGAQQGDTDVIIGGSAAYFSAQPAPQQPALPAQAQGRPATPMFDWNLGTLLPAATTPTVTTPAATVPVTTTSYGGGGGYYNGNSGASPFNPFSNTPAVSNLYSTQYNNPAFGSLFSPYNTVAPNPYLAGQSNQVVYAHYAPGQAVAGQQANNGAANANGGGDKPAGDKKPADAKPADAKPADDTKPADAKAAEEKKAADAKKAAADKKAADAKKAEPAKPEPKIVTVKSGDSLSKIAAAHGTSWQKLYEANKAAVGDNPNLIHAGLKLKLP